jgi:glycerophosphoryl diester phosphodiesterase
LAVLLPLAAVCTGAQAGCAASAPSRLNGLFYGPAAGNAYVTVLAHRGLWGKYNPDNHSVPENSRSAVVSAADHCMDAMELDVKMTKDGVPVLMHDYNLGRTTNVWTKMSGGSKYNPETGRGTNDTVSSHTAQFVTSTRLLTPDRSKITGDFVPTVAAAITAARSHPNDAPIVFDVKTADAARAVSRVAGQLAQKPTDTMAMKVNATLYTSRAAFAADVPNMRGIPVFVTNNLSRINVAQVRDAWAGGSQHEAIEANVKSVNGLLQGELLNWARNRKSPVGTFNAIPDYPGGGGRFYDNDGHCCYTLADKYVTYNGKRETADHRGDWNYLNSQGFTFVTSDNSVALSDWFHVRGKH